MRQFQQLIKASLLAGTLAGIVLFVFQYFVIVPRIIAAESYEEAEEHKKGVAHGSDHHEHGEWKPAEGFDRNFFTAASTILTGIGFSAIFLALVTLSGTELNVRRGLYWGLAGFACFVVAPGLGLPPEPPGVPVADVAARQIWWVSTAALTGIGLFLIVGSRPWVSRLAGVVCLLVPHGVGAPKAVGVQAVPEPLVREFAIAAVLGNGLFWITLGIAAGFLFELDKRKSLLKSDMKESGSAGLVH